jgi:bifunctional non-homologous end joining protein LigD
MPKLRLPPRAVAAALPTSVKLQVCAAAAEPPAGDGWLHELKHDGHRLVAVLDGRGGMRLISRNGYNRTEVFQAPFERLAGLGREMVLDGEIAVPDAQGVTQIADTQEAIMRRQAERFAYFAFDALHFDGHDLRACPVEERKALLERVLKAAACPRVVHLSHIIGKGDRLFESARAVGCEGIVSKRLGSRYKGGPTRDWIKTKVSTTGVFTVTGFKETPAGRLEAIRVADLHDGNLVEAGEVQFGVGKGLWTALDALREGAADDRGVVPVRSEITLTVKFFGRHRGGAIRDGVVVGVPSGAAK